MHYLVKSITICAYLILSSSAEELAPELAPLAQAHTASTAALAEQRTADLARLRKPFLDALAEADQAATKAGDAAVLRAIEQERQAALQGKLRAELSKELPRKLSPTRRALISAESRAYADFDKRQKALDADYLRKLGALQLKSAPTSELAAQIAREKARVVSGIRGAITDLKSGLAGTKWRLFQGDGFDELRFGEDGKVNGNWIYEIGGRDKVKVIWDKGSAMSLTLGKDGTSLAAGDKIWVLNRD